MKVCQSRKNMFSVMNNAHFGDMVIEKGSFTITLPQTAINQTSQSIKKAVLKHLNRLNEITLQEVLHLQQTYGVEVTVR